MTLKKTLTLISLLLIITINAYAVFNERAFPQTISVLKQELKQEYSQLQKDRAEQQSSDSKVQRQRTQMREMNRRCNELELMLYSQDEGFTFDQAYAMDHVFDQYNAIKSLSRPHFDNIDEINSELDRYTHLWRSLNNVTYSTPAIKRDIDTCLNYVSLILSAYRAEKYQIHQDSVTYANMSNNLSSAYNYAVANFEKLQDEIYEEGQDDYISVLTSFPSYWRQVQSDCRLKYSDGNTHSQSRWRGSKLLSSFVWHLVFLAFIIICGILLIRLLSRKVKIMQAPYFRMIRPLVTLLTIIILYTLVTLITAFTSLTLFDGVAVNLILLFMWMTGAILLAIIVGVPSAQTRNVFYSFLPLITLGLFVTLCRMLFIPDTLLNLLIAPVSVVVTLWNLTILISLRNRMPAIIITFQWIAFALMVYSAVQATLGYIFYALQYQMYALFQTAFLATIYAIRSLLLYYESHGLDHKRRNYAAHNAMASSDQKGDFIHVTWLYDFIMQALLPIASLLSVVLCVWLAAELFNLGASFKYLFVEPFISLGTGDDVMLEISAAKLVSVGILFFLFRYLNYLTRSLYRVNRYEKAMRESGLDHVSANQVNLTLANNLIGIFFWGLFIIYSVVILKIPVGALSAVLAGLAAGIGLALKDVLNNFIYGIQLMSGRVRVGDFIECDGVRGTVIKIAYQTTDVLTVDGPVVSFTNTTLFNLNFKNITKNTPYEFLKITVGIAYNSDLDNVRELLTHAMREYLDREDAYGRKVVDPDAGISIVFDEFLDSSVQIAIKQNVRPECQPAYKASVKEMVFNLFRDNNIEIPFNQQEIRILNSN